MTADQSAALDRKLADLYTEEADLLERLRRRQEPATRRAYASRLAVVHAELDRLSYHAFDAWDAERMTEEGEP